MRKNYTHCLFFFAGILFAIASLLEFINNNSWIVNLCLAITFMLLGVDYKKKSRNKT
ncbi:MAG TPA: hypothetical protein GXZ21_06845 [Clostridiales bacterium]|nr:hypothetical protein [Clostridiales bacterium]